MGADGANLKRLTEGEDDIFPLCSQVDNKWVYYWDGKDSRDMRVPLDGGKSEFLASPGVLHGEKFPLLGISRDGTMLGTFAAVPDPATSTYKRVIGVIKTNALNAPAEVLDADPRIAFTVFPAFTTDGAGIAYAVSGEKNEDNVFVQPRDGKPGRQITSFSSEHIFGFAWSPDGKTLAVGRGHVESDVVLLRDTSK